MARFAPKKTTTDQDIFNAEYEHGYSFSTDGYAHILKPGLTEQTVREISHIKEEPEWMLKMRLQAYEQFVSKKTPTWGADLSEINYDEIRYYLRATNEQKKSWDDVPPEVKETFDRLGIPEAERSVLAGVKAQYDCLPADSLVFTSNGLKKIVDIKPGDFVFSLDEEKMTIKLQKVNGLVKKGKRKLFEVVTQGGRCIHVTENHPFFQLSYTRKIGEKKGIFQKSWKHLSDLSVGDLVAAPLSLPEFGKPFTLPKIKYPVTKVSSSNQFTEYELDITKRYVKLNFPTETDTDLMWLLGFYLGDGYRAGKNKNNLYSRIELAIPKGEEALRNEVARIVKRLFNYDVLLDRADRVILNSILFVELIEKLGFAGSAHTKVIPKWVFTLPKEQKLAFISGYFDSNGNIRENRTHQNLVFTSVSESILRSLRLLALDCGLNISNVWKFKQGFFRVQISGNIKLINSRIPKKQERIAHVKTNTNTKVHTFSSAAGYPKYQSHTSAEIGFVKIKSIQEIGEDEVFDIEVDGLHNFIADGLFVHNSEMVYGSLHNVWADQGVVFLSMDEGLKQHPDLVKEYFGKVIPFGDNKFSALNTAVWSGGSFVYVPPGVEVKMPLQTYFRINAENSGQFERTLIIVDEGAKVHYIEGCTAPNFSTGSLHSAVVEIFVKPGARCQYTTVQNWYKNIYNLVTKRAYVEAEGEMVWTDFNMGSKVTMKYPGFVLAGKGARGETLSMALAGAGQHQDTGSKAIHLAPYTSSTILSKSISKNGGRTSYRGLVNVGPHAHHSQNTVICDALLLDGLSRSDTYPVDTTHTNKVAIQHEATVSKIGDDQLFYLMSRGVKEEDARKMIVNGFIEDLVRHLPLEYAVEMNRLIDHEMEGSIG
jgi:Fe-S cluster assembly protein SufB